MNPLFTDDKVSEMQGCASSLQEMRDAYEDERHYLTWHIKTLLDIIHDDLTHERQSELSYIIEPAKKALEKARNE